jgi:outer membrane receptor protein involved in Fe transport
MSISRLSEAALFVAVSLSLVGVAQGAETSQSSTLRQPSTWSTDANVAGVSVTDAIATDSGKVAAEQDSSQPDEPVGEGTGAVDDLLKLDVDQLANAAVVVPVEYTPAALTETPRNVVPATVTRITKEDIHRSGARSLNELLEIYVPNFQWVRHHWENSHIGLRGIIGDKEDKYLLLVNNRIMNDKTHYGAMSERDLVQLDDIDYIDVIRGPGSSVLGPGAVSMIISIYTDTAETFCGTKATVRGGVIDQYSSLELKHGTKWKDAEGGVLLYAGFGQRDGANQWDAPLVFGGSDPVDAVATNYEGYRAGDVVTTQNTRDNQAFDGQMPIKLFADVTYNDWEIWSRYTRSGTQFPCAPSAGFSWTNGWGGEVFGPSEAGTQQVSVQSQYETELTKDLKMQWRTGWDSSDFVRIVLGNVSWGEAYRENELNSRLLFTLDLDDNQFAFGGEFYNDWYGHRGHLIDAPATDGALGANFTPWETQTYSLLLEDQWQINDEWTTFIGGRWDKNTYTPWMYSPRLAVIYAPDKYVTWKAMLNRSLRMNFAEELRRAWLTSGTLSDPEILRSYELRREATPCECFSWAVSAFYIDLDVTGWDGTTGTNAIIGNQTQWGIEGEMSVKKRCWTLTASHAYTQLINFTLEDPTVGEYITAAPYGYGNNLANWSNHITKLVAHRQLTSDLSVDSSLRWYWDYPGLGDMADYQRDLNQDWVAKAESGWERTFRGSMFFNLGLDYKYNRYTTFRVDGYNLLGGFDRDLNKRIYYSDMGFISEAPALGLSCEMQF